MSTSRTQKAPQRYRKGVGTQKKNTSNFTSTNTQRLKHLLELKPKTKMFQLCFSRKRKNPCKLEIYKGFFSSFRTLNRSVLEPILA